MAMHALQPNAQTGYLESPSRNHFTFDNQKKVLLLDKANEMALKGEWPDIVSLCQSCGVSVKAFYTHLRLDEQFRNDWTSIRDTVASYIAKDMHVHSRRPSNYMDRVTLLRHLQPGQWGDKNELTIIQDSAQVKGLFTAIEAEIVQPSSNTLTNPQVINKPVDK